jgi:uncharacterized protein YndB with AHSA1/START domain
MNATYTDVDGRATVAFERRFTHPIDAVWSAITEPAQLKHWFPSTLEGELEAGAPLRFVHEEGAAWEGEMLEVEPPFRLVFMWGEDKLDFTLEPIDGGAGCLMRFVATMGTENKAARDAAGWHVCLDRLSALLGGAAAEAPTSEMTSEWQSHYDAYAASGFPTGAELPSSS